MFEYLGLAYRDSNYIVGLGGLIRHINICVIAQIKLLMYSGIRSKYHPMAIIKIAKQCMHVYTSPVDFATIILARIYFCQCSAYSTYGRWRKL